MRPASTLLHGLFASLLAVAPAVRAQSVASSAPHPLGAVHAVDPQGAPAHATPIDVRLEVTVDREGRVTDVTVVDGPGDPWNAAAVAAMRAMPFEAGRSEGHAVAARLRYRYRFPPTPPSAPTPAPAPPRPAPLATARGATPHDAATPHGATPNDSPVTTSDDGGEATIRSQRPPREVTRHSVEQQEINRIPGTSGDALRVVQNLPGVARAPFMTGLLVVRGAAPQDTAVFFDGSLVPLVYHFGGLTSVVPTDLLDRIDFYPGNFAAQFGRAQGGAIDVGLRAPRTDGWHAMAQASLIDAGVRVEGPISRTLSVLVAARRSYVDAVVGPFLRDAGINAVSLPVYYDYQAVLDWRPTPRDRLRLFGMGSDDRFAFVFSRPQDADPSLNGQLGTSTVFHRVQARWTHEFSPATSLRVVAAAGIDQVGVEFGRVASLLTSRLPIDVRADLTHRVNDRFRWSAGVDVFSGPVSLTFRGPRAPSAGTGDVASTGELAQVATQSTVFAVRPALWTDVELTPVRGLRIVPSLRFDYYAEIAQVVLSPRVSFRITLAPHWFLKGGIGLFSQPPQFQESLAAIDHASTDGRLVGNPNLLPQRALHYGFGIEHEFTEHLTLSIEGFYKTLDRLVVQTGDPSSRIAYENDGVGRAYGLEVLLRHRASRRFFGWIAYTLMRSEFRAHPGQAFNPTDFDQTHIFTAVASWRIGRGWEAGARFRYVTGLPDATVLGTLFDADSLVYIPIYPRVDDVRVPDFHQLDLRVDKTWEFRRWRLGVFLDVMNVYNHANPEFYSYNYNYTQRGIVQGLPILPSLGVRGEF